MYIRIVPTPLHLHAMKQLHEMHAFDMKTIKNGAASYN